MSVKEQSLLFRILARTRRSGNSLLRRVRQLCARKLIRFSDRLAMSDNSKRAARIRQSIAKNAANTAFVLREYPGPTVWRVDGNESSIAYFGPRNSLQPICRLFVGDANPEPLQKTRFRQSATLASDLLADDIDLTIHETSNVAFEVPQSLIRFSIPLWLNQIIAIDKPLRELLAGNKRQVIRRKVRKFHEFCLTMRTTRRKDDFHRFYHDLYLPFVTARHGPNAAIAPYDVQWNQWMKPSNGFLFLISRGDDTLAGLICAIVGDTCHSIEGGVSLSDPELYHRGMWTYLNASAIDWAHAQGLRWFNFGGSRPWLADAVFESKRRWGAHVVARPRPTNRWKFAGNRMNDTMLSDFNDLGLISEYNGEHFAVQISPDSVNSDTIDQTRAIKAGLAGIMRFSNVSGEMKIIRNECPSTNRN